jgi:hypothetical protein
MPQWEYRKINLNGLPRRTEDIDVLTDAGEQGWELIAVAPNNMAYLKRPIESSAPAQQTVAPARTTRRKVPTSAK